MCIRDSNSTAQIDEFSTSIQTIKEQANTIVSELPDCKEVGKEGDRLRYYDSNGTVSYTHLVMQYLDENKAHRALWKGVPISRDGKVQLRDGRTGEFFDGPTTIGHMPVSYTHL